MDSEMKILLALLIISNVATIWGVFRSHIWNTDRSDVDVIKSLLCSIGISCAVSTVIAGLALGLVGQYAPINQYVVVTLGLFLVLNSSKTVYIVEHRRITTGRNQRMTESAHGPIS